MCPNSQWRRPRRQTTEKYNNVQQKKKNKKINTRAEPTPMP
jgi:hypothetical protein